MEYDKILTDILGRKDFLVVGKNVIRTDAIDKALGKARYTSDYVPRDTSILRVFRSNVAHAKIKSIDTAEALKIPGVEAIYTGADVTGNNQIGYALPDQPFLNYKKVHYIGDPIALVVARDEYAAADAMDSIHVDYDPLPAYFDIDAAQAEDAVDIHEGGNIAVTTKIRKGDAVKGFEEADVEVEETGMGGLNLLDLLVNYDRVIIVDAIQTVGGKAGQIQGKNISFRYFRPPLRRSSNPSGLPLQCLIHR